MKRYEVVYGDYLAKIAQQHDTTVAAIWNHPENAGHRAKRGAPNDLYPGDVLWIPVVDEQEPSQPEPPPIPPAPPPADRPLWERMEDLNWAPHVVHQGDYLARLAHERGRYASEVWSYPRNQELAATRDPNILCTNDIIFLPAKPGPRPMPFGLLRHNTYRARRAETEVKVRLVNSFGEPVAETAFFVLDIVSYDPEQPVTTDSGGYLTLTVPLLQRTIRVNAPSLDCMFTFCVGHIDPPDVRSGALGRLQALGHGAPPEGVAMLAFDAPDDLLGAALRRFQQLAGLPANGALDEATVAELTRTFGC